MKTATKHSNTVIILSFITLLFITSNSKSAELPLWQYQQQLPTKPSLRGSAIFGHSLWVSGSNNSVFVSQDGGKTWLNKSVPTTKALPATDFRDIALFDRSTAIVMGVGSGGESRLYKTIDGGNNWQLLYQNTDQHGFFNGIAFWNKKNGLLLGDPVDGYYVIKKTTDGGKTWRRIARQNIPTMIDQEAAFAASGNTLIIGNNADDLGNAWLTTGGLSASVYQSNDFGETWLRSAVPLLNNTQTSGGYALTLNSQNKLFVVGGDYKQRNSSYQNMASYHEGKWQRVNSGQRGLRSSMKCQRNICIATGKNANDISFDHGTTWQPLKNDHYKDNQQGFYTVASDNNLFLFAANDGKVAVLSIN